MQALAETLAEDSHERWARELKCSSPDCHAHPSFVPYVLLDEKKKEELRTYALDLMRYLKVSGFETSRTYRSMSVVMSSSGGDQRYRLMLAWNDVQCFIMSVVMSSSGGDQRYRLMLAWNYVQYFIMSVVMSSSGGDQRYRLMLAWNDVQYRLKIYIYYHSRISCNCCSTSHSNLHHEF